MKNFCGDNIGGLTLTGLSANHDPVTAPQHLLFEKNGKKLFYGCDGAWMMTETFNFLRNKELDVMILDATVGDYEGDYRMAEHNSIPMIRLMIPSLKTGEIVTENTKIYLSHIAPRLHKPHAETAEIVKKDGLFVAYDGLSIEI
jgi:phosphoribosyl 1,2-cyclic phosphate phosphodiesterase